MPIYDMLQSLMKASTIRFDAGFKQYYPTADVRGQVQIRFEGNKASIYEPALEYLISMLVFTLDNRSGGYE